MKQHMQTLIHLLSENDDNALLQHYLSSEESENVVQLAHLFQQGMSYISEFNFYQQLATKLIESKNLPAALIAQIKTNDTLSFFTPALQLDDNFKEVDLQQRNALHYLLAGNKLTVKQPPFNYLRSMMLFGSNGALRDALCQRDSQNLTPIELYLLSNQDLTTLPPHELTALLALIEIESKQQTVDETNYLPTIQAVGKLCANQVKPVSSELQRLILIAIYYTKPIKDIVNEIT
ncbi:MAG: hypothetical protein HRT53_07530 [Colwellia sp.]|nr:hypothetical protein [Colwellia sp.]